MTGRLIRGMRGERVYLRPLEPADVDRASLVQGLRTDAVNAVVDFAFGQLRMERVWLDTDDHNVRAQAAYRKAGFTEEGRFRHAFYQDGQWSDDIRMAILREEWEALPRLKSWELAAKAIETEALVGEGG